MAAIATKQAVRTRPNRDTVEPYWGDDALDECAAGPEQGSRAFPVELARYLGATGTVLWTGSGREALRLFLSRCVPAGSTIVISSFNCPVVADSIHEAGHAVETFDLDAPTGRVDWERVAETLPARCGGIVVTHCFGAPTDFSPLLDVARRRGVLVIEDCAHTLGARIDGRMSGTMGDAAIFSFNHDKPICLGGGGALLINSPERAQQIATRSEPPQWMNNELAELRRFLRAAEEQRAEISRRSLPQRIVRRLRRWAGSGRSPDFPRGLGAIRNRLGLWQLDRYEAVREARNRNALFLARSLRAKVWEVEENVAPAWLRLKVIPEHHGDAPKIARALQRAGYAVGPLNWPRTIDDVLQRSSKPNAAFAARYGLDLPVHQNLTSDDLTSLVQAFEQP